MRIIFENIENTIFVFLKICFCFLNIVFFVFFITKENWELNMFSLFFPYSPHF